MAQSIQHENPKFTYADYLLWSDAERWELINGEAFCMTPAPTTTHQRLVVRLLYCISQFLEGKRCEVFVAPFDVRFCEADAPDEEVRDVVQPDIAVVCDPKKIDERGCKGAPDFVIEVTSPSTSARDQKGKRDLYEKFCVREYWMIDPTRKTLSVYLYDLETSRYAPVQVFEMQGRRAVAALPGLEIDLDEVIRQSIQK